MVAPPEVLVEMFCFTEKGRNETTDVAVEQNACRHPTGLQFKKSYDFRD